METNEQYLNSYAAAIDENNQFYETKNQLYQQQQQLQQRDQGGEIDVEIRLIRDYISGGDSSYRSNEIIKDCETEMQEAFFRELSLTDFNKSTPEIMEPVVVANDPRDEYNDGVMTAAELI